MTSAAVNVEGYMSCNGCQRYADYVLAVGRPEWSGITSAKGRWPETGVERSQAFSRGRELVNNDTFLIRTEVQKYPSESCTDLNLGEWRHRNLGAHMCRAHAGGNPWLSA